MYKTIWIPVSCSQILFHSECLTVGAYTANDNVLREKRSGHVRSGGFIRTIVRETSNVTDYYPVAVDVIIGHL